MHKTLFLSLFVLTLFSGCTKKKKNTSPYTSSEYFTCLVNGEEWVAQTPSNPNGPVAVEVHYESEYDRLNIFATRKNQNAYPTIYDRILLFVDHASSQTPRIFLGTGSTNGYSNYLSSACGIYYYDSLYTGNCSINSWNWDVQEHKFSGSFQVQLRNNQCVDSILTITNGQVAAYF